MTISETLSTQFTDDEIEILIEEKMKEVFFTVATGPSPYQYDPTDPEMSCPCPTYSSTGGQSECPIIV